MALCPARQLSALLVFVLAAPAALASTIEHQAVQCAVAGQFPRFEARLIPPENVVRARVYFRPEGGAAWYAVAMKAAGGVFTGVLPKPTTKLRRFNYYIEATDLSAATARTEEYATDVVAGPAACQDKTMAGAVTGGLVALEAPAGAPAVPAGFSSSGVAATSAATAAATAGVVAAGGGGVGTGVIVAGAAVAAGAGVAVAVAKGGGGDEGGGMNEPPKPTLWDITFSPSFDKSWCTGEVRDPSVAPPPNSTFGGGAFETDAAGNFDVRLPNLSQDVLRLTGRANDTSFSAEMSCLSGRASASLTATGGGSRFAGTYTLAGASGGFAVAKK